MVCSHIVPRAIGCWGESPAGAYRPWVIVEFRSYDSRNGEVVAAGQIGIGPTPPGETAIGITQDKQFAFTSFEALTNDPACAVAGLRAGIRQVAEALAQEL